MNRPILLLCLAMLALLPPLARAELPDPVKFSVSLEMGNVDQAREWLDEGLDPNFEGHLIGTGLMIGAWEGNIALMELFLRRGADIHRVNRFGETALMLAAWKDRKEAMQWLLARGAQPNREERQWTALHYAAFAGHAERVEELIARGADVNARSTNGSTVVMMAAREGHADIARRLVAAGANPALQNDASEDAVAWAMRHGNYDIARSFTSAENFAQLSRQAAADKGRAIRSQRISDKAEEELRRARLAELQGKRKEAADAYRRAFATLKSDPSSQKTGPGRTATPSAIVIRAQRADPGRQTMSYTGASTTAEAIDGLLAEARRAEASGRHAEALELFKRAGARIRATGQPTQ